MRRCKKVLAIALTLAMLLTGNMSMTVMAEEAQQYQLTVTNDCDASVVYTIEINGVAQDVTIAAHESYSQTIAEGMSYKVIWKEGADSTYVYETPEQTEYTGAIGQEEIYYVDAQGVEYSETAVTDVVSYEEYSKSTSKYVEATRVTFTRTYSWPYYTYTNVADISEKYKESSASGARDKIAAQYPAAEGWGMETDDNDLGYCWVFKTVTAQSRASADITLHITASAQPKNQPVVTGEFTVAAMNVDGLPTKIWGVAINENGPGASGSKAIGTYISDSGIDLIGVSEDFNYHSNLMAGATGYNNTTWRGSVDAGALISPADTDGLNLLYKNGITVSGESWTRYNDSYKASGNTYIKKGFRYYQAALADGITIDVYILHADAGSEEGSITSRKSQMSQLAAAINANTSGNPIVIMGDTNCRYTRDYLKESFIDQVSGLKDAWVELIRGEEGYPSFGDPNIVAIDKAGEGDTDLRDYPDCEIVDKVFYLNKAENAVQIQAVEYKVDNTNYVASDGSELGDHWPLIVKFEYTKKGNNSCEEHSWKLLSTVNPDFMTDGYTEYECELCGEKKREVIPKLTALSVVDEAVTVKGETVTIDVLANDTICTDSLVASKELLLEEEQNPGALVQDEKVIFTPAEAGIYTINYAVKYTLTNGTTYTTEPAAVSVYVYGMTDNTYVISEGSTHTFLDVLENDVLQIEGRENGCTVQEVESTEKYGTFAVKGSTVTYELQQYLAGVDSCEINVAVTDGTTAVALYQHVNVVPDTVVYYDDNFGANADSVNSDTTENKYGCGIYFGGTWSTDTEVSDNYHSNTVTSTSEGLATAEFSFAGTGLDIMGQTDAVGGTITVQVWKKALSEYTNENRTAIKIVNTADDTYGTLYQIPIIHIDMQERDEYYVKIMLTPNLDGNSGLNYGNLYLDGIRIYGALALEEQEKYYSEEKQLEEIMDIHSCLDVGNVVFVNAENQENIVAANNLAGTDEQGNAISDADMLKEYIKAGPNHEAYFQNGNGIAFYVVLNSGVTAEEAALSVSARRPQGNDEKATLKYAKSSTEATEIEVFGTTAQYYEIDLTKCVEKQVGVYLIILTNPEAGLMAIENICCSGLVITSTLEDTGTVTAQEVGSYVRMMVEEKQPAVLKATVKSVFGKTLGVVEVTSGQVGVAGECHTFTGEEVYQQIKAEGYKIWNMGIRRKNYIVEYGTVKDIVVK